MMEAFIGFPIVKPRFYNVNQTNKHLVIDESGHTAIRWDMISRADSNDIKHLAGRWASKCRSDINAEKEESEQTSGQRRCKLNGMQY